MADNETWHYCLLIYCHWMTTAVCFYLMTKKEIRKKNSVIVTLFFACISQGNVKL